VNKLKDVLARLRRAALHTTQFQND